MRRAVLSLLCLAGLLRADFNPSRWQYRRPLIVEQPYQVHAVVIDRTVYAASLPGLDDLRVARGSEEIPYVLETSAGSLEERELRPEILDRSAGRDGLQLTLDLAGAAKHNRLRVTTALKNFRIRVRIETSEDRRRWAIARDDGYIFDFSQGDRNVSVLTVEYPVSTRRYVRATFFGWTRTDAAASAWLTHYQERPAVWQTVATAAPARFEDRNTTVLTFDLGVSAPHSRMHGQTGAAAVQRACAILSSDNAKDWEFVSQDVFYRFPDEPAPALNFPERHERYLRLRILNGDDRPLQVGSADFQTLERRARFLPTAAGEYALYYGNPKARAPRYDLAAILARSVPATAPEATIAAGPEQRNPAYRPPQAPEKPWSERHPEILWVTLAAAVLGMGYVTVRFLLKVAKAPPQ